MGNGNFKIGDKVKRISNPYNDVKIGTTGIVTKINDGCDTVRVKIDCTGVEGTWAYSYIEKVDNKPTMIIYRKGRETIATLKDGNQTIKTAKAICNPKDEFNAEYGAKLAFARLYGLDEQVTEILLNGIKYIKMDGNFKARCIKTWDTGLTAGNIYEFRNGYSNWNDGQRLPQHTKHGISRFSNFSDLVKWFGGTASTEVFEEVIEEPIPSGVPITVPQPFDWEGFKSGRFAVHCDTEEKAKSFLWECEQQDIQWGSASKPTTRTYFERYGAFTCYSCIWGNSCIGYGEVALHKGNRPIIDYTPNYREVKRPAKVGEWIKIVDISFYHDGYSNGDILRVEELHKEHEKNGVVMKPHHIVAYEYVVLEPIAPTNEAASATNQSEPRYVEVNRQAKVGELIKIVKKGAHGPELNVGDIHRVTGKANSGTIGTDKGNRFIGTEHNEYVVLEPVAVSSQPKATIDIKSISDDELLAEVLRRLKK